MPKRGASSGKRLGESFEDVVALVWDRDGCASRGHPATKVVRAGRSTKVVFLAKNGVDFSGVLWGLPVAVECKRLPGTASLSGVKDASTRAEAAWLLRYYARRGKGGFLVYDPEADEGHGRVYAVTDYDDLKRIAAGQAVPLRARTGAALVDAWDVRGMTEGGGLAEAVERALRFIAEVAP